MHADGSRARFARRALVGARFGALSATGLWLADVAALLITPDKPALATLAVGASAALFVALTTGLAVGAVGGVVLLPELARLARAMRASRARIASWTLAAAALLPFLAWIVYRVVDDVELRFARLGSIGAAMVLSHFAFAAVLAIAWPSATRIASAVVRGAARVRGLRAIVAEPWRLPALLVAVVALASAPLAWSHRFELRALPWPEIARWPGLAIGAFVAVLVGRAPDRARTATIAIVALLFVSGVASASMHVGRSEPRVLAYERTESGRAGYAAWSTLLDFDGDGQIGWLGGGDCAPFDARRHVGAIDVPGNGVDEDCDGADLPAIALVPRPHDPAVRGRVRDRPSIVLITIDGLSAPRLAALGQTPPLVPNLDAFAAGGALFTSCFAQGPSTRLSFPSMFTSRWDSQLVRPFALRPPFPIDASERQLQDLLDDRGYETVAVIPHALFEPSKWPSITRGFQRVDASAIALGEHNAPAVTDAAIRALEAPRDRPLYLWVHYYDAHSPFEPVPGIGDGATSESALYGAELTFLDRELGRLFAAIDADSTYVFVAADHATVFHPSITNGRHYGYDLRTATLHVPLVVRGPGIVPARIDGVVSTMDIVPTALDLAGADGESAVEGTSLLPEVMTGARDPSRVVFHEFYLPERDVRGEDPLRIVSARTGTWDLVLDRARGAYELYDWRADYYEQHDRLEEQAGSPELARLRSMLGAFVHEFHQRPPGAALLPPPGEER